ncbi:hypothetical protein DAT35_37505 [Vitiosangium sp. GDMCC 1.1324]|nr:hypothetical protein DAT35_37505 [Vitiosangium sp. GDMCC 1.1324]
MPWTVKEASQGGLHVALQAHHCLARATGCRELLERVRPSAESYSQSACCAGPCAAASRGGRSGS